ncbi:hypothetical protein TrVE_jg9346 [Triparma verrucosa]|uniref:Thioredoxin domain-containing protein n=2 Tax=Triparma TaxID=722752 RepID=A0A9W7ERQ5_9STRA|nr:hypothetical protein TrVE_jg9346 [Triparma verrucosa]GMH87515.1 hypothetical protein TrST_g13294 [Triparma strigata]
MSSLLPDSVPLLSTADNSVTALPSGIPTLLLFSSSWCPDCKPFMAALSVMYEDLNEDEKQFEVVYVSSDRTEEECADYVKKMPGWLYVPFSQVEHRTFLKTTLKSCAGSEQAPLGITERKFGIPNLVVLKGNDVVKECANADVEGFRGDLPTDWA